MKTTFSIVAMLAMAATPFVSAHMEMTEPAPFRSKDNPHATTTDFDMTSPLSADGSNFPCKGYHSDFGTAAGASVATYEPGQSYKFTISGGAAHNGGSCQASLSFDKGSTWTVIHSYEGNCPLSGESSFDFTVPSDTPAGEAIFSWSWFNKVGNREMYQNCAAVTIGGSSSKKLKKTKRADSFSSRPQMFVANVGNECTTVEGKDVEFPSPGPDVTNDGADLGAAEGSGCATSSGGGGGSDGGDSGTPSAAPSASAAPSEANPGIPATSAAEVNPGIPSAAPTTADVNPGIPSAVPTETPVTSGTPVATTPISLPGGVFITSPSEPEASATVSAPSTLVTVTNPVVNDPVATPEPVTTPPANVGGDTTTAPPAATPSTPTTAPSTGGGAGSMTPGEACTSEGQWNCVGGTQFQRCASGQWSALIAMAAGTTCQEGVSDNFVMARSHGRAVRLSA